MSTIVIASGGTGGHLYPTVAIAETIRDKYPEHRIVFIGTSERIESREVPRLGFEFFPIEIKAPGKSFGQLIRFPYRYMKALRRSEHILRDEDAAIVLGGGAYLSVPVAFAAKKMRIPIVLLEINAVAGRANRIVANDAEKIFVSYQESIAKFPAASARKIEVIGTPVRDALLREVDKAEARKMFGLDPARKTLLVFGGSLGARSLNTAMRRSAKKFLEEGMNIIWQTGASANVEELRREFPDSGRIAIREYIAEMPEAYAASDLALCRAGASTLAELSTLGKPAILVPYPLAAMNHQQLNAEAYRDRGAARVLADSELEAKLEMTVTALMNDDVQREAMAKKMLARENITARNVVAEYLVGHLRTRA